MSAPERCDGCGFVWDLVPAAEQASRLADVGPTYRRLLLPPDRPVGWTERAATRPGADTWSALEYACHTRDVLLAMRERILTALVEDDPSLPPLYRDERVALAGYAAEDLAVIVAEIEVAADLLARQLARLDRAQLARTLQVVFPTPSSRSLAWVGAQAIHEAEHHAIDIAAQIAPFDAGLEHVRRAPTGRGRVELVVARPGVDERVVLQEARLTLADGLEGDSWNRRSSRRTADGSPFVDAQLNVVSSRAIQLFAGDRDRWALAGDQLYVDLDLSEDALPPGSRLAVGSAVIEVTPEPHRGCAKFSARFGLDALRAVNSAEGRALRLRGLNARVVVEGVVRPGDTIEVLPGA
jgi:hypothetical protein